MSILNVNKINPVGGGSTITITGIASVTNNISVGNSVTANAFYGSGANLTGIDATKIETGNTKVETIDTGSDGHIKFTTEGGERLRITSGGAVIVADTSAYSDGTFGEAKLQFNAKTGNHIGACSVADTTNSISHVLFKNPNGAIASVGTHNSDFIVLTGNQERLRINSSGHVTKPTNPSFRATASSSLDYTSDNTLAFQNEKHDVGGYYNNSNSYYTIPTTGYYKFEVMHFAQPGQIARVQLERSTDGGSSWSAIQIGPRIESSGGGRYIAGWMHVFHEFTATNLVRVRWSQGNVHINNGYGWFQGWLVN